MNTALTNLTSWGQKLLLEILAAGDFAIDLTAGNGYDTLMLAQAVGPSGRVLAFDLQQEAIEKTSLRLGQQGIKSSRLKTPVSPLPPGVSLVHADHAQLGIWSPPGARAIIANLGYFPGGNKAVVTKPETTLSALVTGCDLLVPGGRLAVVVYPGHPGGQVEADTVMQFFSELDGKMFEVLRLQVVGRQQAPFLLIASKFN